MENNIVAYFYNGDNFPRTFREGDKLYVMPGNDVINGKIHLLQTSEGVQLKRVYADTFPGAYCLIDELAANGPEKEARPDIIGHVVGFERMFSAEE